MKRIYLIYTYLIILIYEVENKLTWINSIRIKNENELSKDNIYMITLQNIVAFLFILNSYMFKFTNDDDLFQLNLYYIIFLNIIIYVLLLIINIKLFKNHNLSEEAIEFKNKMEIGKNELTIFYVSYYLIIFILIIIF